MNSDRKKLIVSASPHVYGADTSRGIMGDVIIALIPALAASIAIFGFQVLAVVAVTVLSSVISEYLARKIMKRNQTIGDLSAVVTGLLLAFNLPVDIPLWMAAIGSLVAIVVVKQFFGGIGQNFVNPAIAGRIVLFVSFPAAMSQWADPLAWKNGVEALTSASPLVAIKSLLAGGDVSAQALNAESSLPSLLEMFLGYRQGSLGEVCAAALIIGGIYLLIRRVISPAIPLTFIGTVAVIMLIAGKGSLAFVAYEILGGGLLLGAIFMATDYATSPINFKGKLIFGIGCGLITSVIRLFGSMAEGVSFAIIIMNILVPHIENLTAPKPFGTPKKERWGKKNEQKA